MSNNSEIRKMSKKLKKIPKLSKKKEAYLIRNLKSKNKLRREVAIQKLWQAKLYLIINVVWKVRNIGIVPELSEGDLLSEASIGLLLGIKGPKLGNQDMNVNAYLKKAILNHLRTFIKSKSRMIAIKGTWRKIKELVEAWEELSQRNMASPSKKEIAEFLGLRQSEIEKAYFWLKEKKISLDSQIKDEESLSWHDVISAKNRSNQEES